MSNIDYNLMALRIVQRYAKRHSELTIADVRPMMNAAGIPDSVRMNVMRAAVAKGYIYPAGKIMVKKNRTKSSSAVTIYGSSLYDWMSQ